MTRIHPYKTKPRDFFNNVIDSGDVVLVMEQDREARVVSSALVSTLTRSTHSLIVDLDRKLLTIEPDRCILKRKAGE